MHGLGFPLLALLLGSGASGVLAADRFVSTTGSDAANGCLSSLSPCVTVGDGLAQATNGDTVKVAVGTYDENVSVFHRCAGDVRISPSGRRVSLRP